MSPTIPATFNDLTVAVNPATNKIYFPNPVFGTVTVLDGTNNSVQSVTVGTGPIAAGINPLTNKIYVPNNGSANVTVITPAPSNTIPLNTAVTPFGGNTTSSFAPSFTLTATSTYSPTAPPPQSIYFQIDSTNGTWTRATNTGSTPTTVTATANAPVLKDGLHIIYFFASDGSDATSINPFVGQLREKRPSKRSFDPLTPESSPVAGGINAYLFLVKAIPTAAAVGVSGRILTADGNGVRNAVISLSDLNGVTRTAKSSSFGYFQFDGVIAGETYVLAVAHKRYRFASPSRIIAVSDEITDADFIASP